MCTFIFEEILCEICEHGACLERKFGMIQSAQKFTTKVEKCSTIFYFGKQCGALGGKKNESDLSGDEYCSHFFFGRTVSM